MESKFNLKIIVITIGLLLPAISLNADTYRWKDKDGKLAYGAVVPAEYAGQPYDVLNADGIVIDNIQYSDDKDTETAEQQAQAITPSDRDLIRQLQSDRLLIVQYQSEEEIATALELEIIQLGYDAKLIHLSFDATSNTIREFIKRAADQQRAGQPIRPDQQKEARKLYRHLSRDEKRLAKLEDRKAEVRARFQADLKRYRQLKQETKELQKQG